ncbi:hypothetical protein Tco_0441886 [Tanacetum coccineum]
MASMPSANPMLVDLNEMENIFQTLFKLIQKICKRDEKEMNPIIQKLYFYFILFQNQVKNDVKEMNDVFVSVENDLDETFKQNELLKDRSLDASLTESHREMSQKNVLEKDLFKIEAKSIAFEIALQHKSRENNSLKTVQKENENFMASLQLENAHLKQTYKDLFEPVQRSKIDELEKVLTQQTKDFNAVKLELSNRTAKFKAYFEKLEKTKVFLERQLARKVDDSKVEKDQFLKKMNHLISQLVNLKESL